MRSANNGEPFFMCGGNGSVTPHEPACQRRACRPATCCAAGFATDLFMVAVGLCLFARADSKHHPTSQRFSPARCKHCAQLVRACARLAGAGKPAHTKLFILRRGCTMLPSYLGNATRLLECSLINTRFMLCTLALAVLGLGSTTIHAGRGV